ncbi:hypothetical protein HHK36_023185 [Tetracentron sinense]|uniref:Protein FAR1-RELATED SEQUENCE n=1 Tax=Tetracentron sinense TaxID=13715 RepID=A0A835D5M4_TETSI|nr:hypothetical protein HHK36_023185 [Tetracentron sinense]
MEIDLELPSGDHDKEDTVPNVSINMLDDGDEVHGDVVSLNSPAMAEHDKEDTRPNASGNKVDGGNEVHSGDVVGVNSPTIDEHVKEDTRPDATGNKVDGGNKVHGGDGVDVNSLTLDNVSSGGDTNLESSDGIEFESKEAAYSFYKEYAKSLGFCPSIKASRRSKLSGKFIDVKFVCSRHGRRQSQSTVVNPRPSSKTGCKASMHVKRKQDGKWIIHSFIEEHNHEIFPDRRSISLGYNNTDPLHAARERIRKMYVEMSKQSGGSENIGSQKNDIKNPFFEGQHLALEEGDTQVMLEHFMHMQGDNPHFFYAIDLNEGQRLRNLFWVDAKAMGGRAPRVILTDQDKDMKEAIAEVFPNARHYFGLWHLLRKIPEKLGHVTKQHENFMTKFNKCVYRSWTDEQFEKKWWKMVERFDLKEDEWIQSLYEDRKRWAPVYMGEDTILAGMSATQRSESINSYFDKFMHRNTTVKEFVEQYKAVLQDRYEEEAKADFDSWHKQPALKSPSLFEKQMSTVYTHAIFKKFQAEVLGSIACIPKKESEDGSNINFRVQDFEEHQDFIVVWNDKKSDVSCLCRSFEYKGFLCRHAMIILQFSGVYRIPSHYILKRWTKDAKSRQTVGQGLDEVQSRVERYNQLCQQAIKLADEGSLSRDSYNIAFLALEEALNHCPGVDNLISSVDPSTSATHGLHDIEGMNQGNSTTKAGKRNNTSRKRKTRAEAEVITIGAQDSWQQMGQLSSRSPTLDGYYGTQQCMQGMGQINSIAPARDGYYTNPQSMQDLGQLNSIAPSYDGHYGTQQSMQGLGQIDFRSPTMHSYNIQDSLQDMEQANIRFTQLHGATSKHLREKHL